MKGILIEEYNLTFSLIDKGIHSFPKVTSLKFNIIAPIDFEPTHYDFSVQHVRHNSTDTLFASHYGIVTKLESHNSRSDKVIILLCGDYRTN